MQSIEESLSNPELTGDVAEFIDRLGNSCERLYVAYAGALKMPNICDAARDLFEEYSTDPIEVCEKFAVIWGSLDKVLLDLQARPNVYGDISGVALEAIGPALRVLGHDMSAAQRFYLMCKMSFYFMSGGLFLIQESLLAAAKELDQPFHEIPVDGFLLAMIAFLSLQADAFIVAKKNDEAQ